MGRGSLTGSVVMNREAALAYLVVRPGTAEEQVAVVNGRLFVGRECAGIDDRQRLVLDEPDVSRNHFEIRLRQDSEVAHVVDLSTNGTRLNGVRIERATAVTLRSGDRLLIGNVEMEFRSESHQQSLGVVDPRATARRIYRAPMALVVGDIIGYSTMSEGTSSEVIAGAIERLFAGLRRLVHGRSGTLTDLAGDAFFAVWELDAVPDAAASAVEFALDARDLVGLIAPVLGVRAPDGGHLEMGWAVVVGDAGVTTLAHGLISVLGDATNLAFRLSGLAGRDGRPPVIVTRAVSEQLGDRFAFGPPEEVTVKGRVTSEVILGVTRRS